MIDFEVPGLCGEKNDKLVRFGGGSTNHNNCESKIVNARLSVREVDLMQLPTYVAYESYQVFPSQLNNTTVKDIREFPFVPTGPICRKMLDDLRTYSGKGVPCIKTSNGQVFTKNDLNNIISQEFKITAKKEIKNERKWLREISGGNLPYPDGLPIQNNVEYVQNAVSYLQIDEVGDRRSFHGLGFDSVRGMMNNQYMTDEYLVYMSNKINKESPSDSFCFFMTE